ncbi:Uncharacterized protein Adt_34971 [Abeliophyllum distichum]|uniref:Uncharacterized protein n=1 Tax=Abeliophyllum distichum TaxID=126358 RepID=A0ABD1QDD9_9LAMI
MAVRTYYEAGTSALLILAPHQETPNKYCLVHRSYGHSTEKCREVENLANKREAGSGARRRGNTRCRAQSSMHSRRSPGLDRRSQQWDKRPANYEPPRRNSRNPARHPRTKEIPKHHFLKGPEKPPICEIDTIYKGPYIGGQSQNAQKSYAKEAEGKLLTNLLINSRYSNKVDPISFTEEEMRGFTTPTVTHW